MDTQTITVHVLASDFKNNNFWNCREGLKGCPMQRATTRAGIKSWANIDCDSTTFHKNHRRVKDMFDKKEPIQDFSFEFPVIT
jgi:hypothetical protein